MLDFKKIELSDKQWVDELLGYSDFRRTEDCFTSLYIWTDIYKSSLCRYGDFLVTRSFKDDLVQYLYPAGKGDLKELIQLLDEDARSLGKPFSMVAIPARQVAVIEELFPKQFDFSPTRDSFDYIYERERLASLSGKKLQSKRNHIARFKELKDWQYETFDWTNREKCEILIPQCLEMNDLWCKQNKCLQNLSLLSETCAVRKALSDFIPLRLRGGLLRLEGKVIAYTVGEPLNSDTFIVHIEKAFSEINGAYPMINQSFVKSDALQFKYVNREDDAGDEGLRTAKLSYNPIFMEEKYCAIKK